MLVFVRVVKSSSKRGLLLTPKVKYKYIFDQGVIVGPKPPSGVLKSELTDFTLRRRQRPTLRCDTNWTLYRVSQKKRTFRIGFQ